MREDDFDGDNARLISSIDALLDLDDAKALVPHGLGGRGAHAYRLLVAARHRLSPDQLRLNLSRSRCELRDNRWSIHIDAGDDPCNVTVNHRRYGDYYDWPDAAHGASMHGGACKAADRAYAIQDESNFRTRSAALKAASAFLRRFGAGNVEHLEWDIDGQRMVVVGHQPRARIWWKHPHDTPDPLAPYYGHTEGSDLQCKDTPSHGG